MEKLAGVVPLVDGLGDVDALVALQAQQLPAGPGRQHLGHLGLAHAGLALEQQRAVQGHGQEDRRRQPLVGQVAMGGEGGGHLFYRECGPGWSGHPYRLGGAGLLEGPAYQHLGQVAAVLGAGVEVRGRVEPVRGMGGRLGGRCPTRQGRLDRRRPAAAPGPC